MGNPFYDKAIKKAVDQYNADPQRRWEQLAATLPGLANQGIDMSFRTPEYLAAENAATIAPIQQQFGTARRQGINASLQTGAPVGAFITGLQGQEGDVLGRQGAQNYLSDVGLGADIAQRRFGNVFGLTQFGEQQRQFNEQLALQKKAQRRSFLSSLGGIAGMAVGAGFNPFSAVGSLFKGNPNPADYAGYQVPVW